MTNTKTHTDELQIAVIIGSTRRERVGRTVADWVADQLRPIERASVDLIDLVDVDLPSYADLRPGGGEPSPIAERIAEADAYVIVTPEYNRSYPAPLKHLIDLHYREWMFKPATLVSYGVAGGHSAAEHLRSVFSELHVVVTRRLIALPAPWNHLDDTNCFSPDDSYSKAMEVARAELTWWAYALKERRESHPFGA